VGDHKRGNVEMSRLGEVERVKRTLKLFDMILNKHIDSINPEDNSLPIDGLHWLISMQADCEDLIKYLSDYDSYDPG
jgi:hypothetical protein